MLFRSQHDDDEALASFVLGRIRHIYIALHQDTGFAPTRFSAYTGDRDQTLKEPSSYPVCKVLEHHLNSAARIHDDNDPTNLTRAVPDNNDNATLVPSFLARRPHTPFSPSTTPFPVDEALTDTLLDSVSS